MIRRLSLTGLIALSLALGQTTPARAFDPVTRYIAQFMAEYVGGKVLDSMFDSVTGKPDLGAIARRLKLLEQNGALRSEMQQEVRRLREGLNARLTKEEFKKALVGLQSNLGDIKKRISALEERSELQEVQISDLKARTRNAESASTFAARGYDFAAKGEHYRAMANYAIAIRLDPKLASAYVSRGGIFEKLKAPLVAMVDYDKAVSLDPRCVSALQRRAYLHNTAGRHSKAIADSTAALAVNKNDPSCLFSRGYAHYQLRSYDKCIADYKKCLEGRPTYTMAWNNLGAAYQEKGRHDLALESFDKAIKQDARSTMFLSNRAWSNYSLGKHTAAIADANKAVALDPNWRRAREARGLAMYASSRYKEALPDLNKAIELGTGIGRVYAYRGQQRYMASDYRNALYDLDAAVRLGETGWDTYRYRGEVNYRIARYADAVRDLGVVYRANPDRSTMARVCYFRGMSHLMNNDRISYRSDIGSCLFYDPSYSRYLSEGDVMVANYSKTPITIVLDYYIPANGKKQSFFFRYTYSFAPGSSGYLFYSKKQIVAKQFVAYVETTKGKKRYRWDYDPRKGATLLVAVNNADLP